MGESFARWLLKEQKRELQYEILVACIARNSTKIRLVASSARPLLCSDSIPLDWEWEYGGAAGTRIGPSAGSGM